MHKKMTTWLLQYDEQYLEIIDIKHFFLTLRIVDVTDAPRSIAPRNSHIAAMSTACLSEMDLADT